MNTAGADANQLLCPTVPRSCAALERLLVAWSVLDGVTLLGAICHRATTTSGRTSGEALTAATQRLVYLAAVAGALILAALISAGSERVGTGTGTARGAVVHRSSVKRTSIGSRDGLHHGYVLWGAERHVRRACPGRGDCVRNRHVPRDNDVHGQSRRLRPRKNRCGIVGTGPGRSRPTTRATAPAIDRATPASWPRAKAGKGAQ